MLFSAVADRAMAIRAPELLRLNEGATGELLPGNPQRETEIVFDSGTRSGLPARRIPLENLDTQALRGSINRGGQPAGPGSDDDQIAHLSLIDFVVQPEAGGRFGIGRIAQGLVAAADQDRNVRDGNREMLENRMDRGIGLDIEVVCEDGRCG